MVLRFGQFYRARLAISDPLQTMVSYPEIEEEHNHKDLKKVGVKSHLDLSLKATIV